jgi:putative ATP-dependent endonuclease of OLD family
MATITRLRAYNFRSVGAEVEISFPERMPLVLVGENNCGKSNLVRALDLVLGQQWPGNHDPDDNEFHQRDRSQAMWVAVDFHPDDRFGRGFDRVVWRYDAASEPPILFRAFPGYGGHEDSYVSNEDRSTCTCITIEAERNLQYQLSYASKYTLMSRLMHRFHKVLSEDEATKTQLLELFRQVRERFNGIQPFVDFTEMLQTRLGDFAENMQHRLEVDFEAYNPVNFFQALRLHAVDGAERRTLAEMGTGEQQVLALSLAYAYATAFHEGIVLVVEEPESHLHPLAQQWLAKRLQQMAAEGLQLVITTHSAHFLDLTALPGIVLVRKDAGNTTVVQRTIAQLIESCVATGAPAARTTPGNILPFYAANAVPEILEGFFARAVVLVEGRTESLALPILWNRLGFDNAKSGVAVVAVGGKGNLGKWRRMFEAYDIPTYVIFDNDASDDASANKRMDALAAMLVPAERRPEFTNTTEWIVEQDFTVFGRDFERSMRQHFGDYAALEAEARHAGVDAKPFVARWVAERLPLGGDGEAKLRSMVDRIGGRLRPGLAPVPQEV